MAVNPLRSGARATSRLSCPWKQCSARQMRARVPSAVQVSRSVLRGSLDDSSRSRKPNHDSDPVGRSTKAVGEILCSSLLFPMSASAAEQLGGVDPSSLVSFVDTHSGSAPIVFYLMVTMAEIVPLVPTQPFALSAGLLLGGYEGTLVVWAGTLTAAMVAFQLGRGTGQKFVRRLLDAEAGGESEKSVITSKLSDFQKWIDKGDNLQQVWGMILLRLTPVVPFSASNYGLSLTVLPFWVFTVGTAIGMAPWVAFYAFVGSTGRNLLNNGVDPGVIFQGFSEKIDSVFETYGVAGVGVFAALFATLAVTSTTRSLGGRKEGPIDE